MDNQKHNNTPETVRQPLNVFPAGLSLVCPGLGQLAQGRVGTFLWHTIVWIPVVVYGCLLYHSTLPIEQIGIFKHNQAIRNCPSNILFLILSFSLLALPFLLAIPFALLSILDAATWKRKVPSPFKKYLVNLTWCLIPLYTLLCLLIPAVSSAREAARRMQCSSHNKGLALALHNYHDVHGHFPPAYTVDEDGNPLHSWRVLILPYIEQRELYEKIRLDEPWDSEHNRQFHGVQIRHFQCPSRGRILTLITTEKWINGERMRGYQHVLMNNHELFQFRNCDYSVVIGKDTVFPGSGRTVSLGDITSSSSNTILIVERMVPVNWMDPNNEIRFDAACMGVNKYPQGIGSKHPGGMNAALADTRIQFLTEDTDIKLLLTKSAEDE